MKLWSKTLVLACAALACTACGSKSLNPDFDGTERVSIDGLTAYSVVKGTVTVPVTPMMEVTVDKVELLRGMDGEVVATATAAPYSLSWDTTAAQDGLEVIWARATDQEGNTVESPVIKLVVLNVGAAASILGGNPAGEVRIPTTYDGTQEVDIRKYWDNPAGIHTIVALLYFQPGPYQATWNVGLSIGKGYCPERGRQYGPEQGGTESPLSVTVKSTDVDLTMTEFPATPPNPDPEVDRYFVHVRPNNGTDHRGEELQFRTEVYLLP
ncbi:MAG: Ig-like domain-containing protein [Deltaproteobacteria bacterium]|nr:Ig-like domain-containing protein [Deltaproteobacteria bacterium]